MEDLIDNYLKADLTEMFHMIFLVVIRLNEGYNAFRCFQFGVHSSKLVSFGEAE